MKEFIKLIEIKANNKMVSSFSATYHREGPRLRYTEHIGIMNADLNAIFTSLASNTMGRR